MHDRTPLRLASNWEPDRAARRSYRPYHDTRVAAPARQGQRRPVLLVLLMLSMLANVAAWTPERLRAMSANAFELLLATETSSERASATAPRPLHDGGVLRGQSAALALGE